MAHSLHKELDVSYFMMTEGKTVQPKKDARKAGLRYVSETSHGITRKSSDKQAIYSGPNGKPIRDQATLRRIKSLVIPPAWTSVWISPSAHGHIQAVGRDTRGRKQYRYHAKWLAMRDRHKYDHALAFGRALRPLRQQVNRDLRRTGLPREKNCRRGAPLGMTLIRIGNDEYERQNHSYGLTTMRNRHVQVRGKTIEFDFRGKSGKQHHISLQDPRLAGIIRRCQELPGQDLFAYCDENNQVHAVNSQDVNDYLHRWMGAEYTAKDFRTWSGTVLAAMAFHELAEVTSITQAERNVKTVVESVAKILGNTPSVCRKCYIHPEIIHSYLKGVTLQVVSQRIGEKLSHSVQKLRPVEAAVLALLQKKIKKQPSILTFEGAP